MWPVRAYATRGACHAVHAAALATSAQPNLQGVLLSFLEFEDARVNIPAVDDYLTVISIVLLIFSP